MSAKNPSVEYYRKTENLGVLARQRWDDNEVRMILESKDKKIIY